jgi:hypothetical protein
MLDILWTKLAAVEAKESAKRQKKQARKSSGKDRAKANSKAVNELGCGEDSENKDLADDDVASGRRTILVKYTVLFSGLCCSSLQPTYHFNSWSDPSQFHLTDRHFGFVRSGNTNASQGRKPMSTMQVSRPKSFMIMTPLMSGVAPTLKS